MCFMRKNRYVIFACVNGPFALHYFIAALLFSYDSLFIPQCISQVVPLPIEVKMIDMKVETIEIAKIGKNPFFNINFYQTVFRNQNDNNRYDESRDSRDRQNW